nr:calcium-binding protein [Bradyrhizobium sp. 199]
MTHGPSTFTWIGSAGYSVTGSSFGANTFELNGGVETVTGGNNGNNTYIASSATGQAIIYPNEKPGSFNELDFIGGITDENLWFVQSGNDLTIDVLGTNSSVTVKGWFSNSANQLQEIEAGGLKIDSQISQLVQAMATYSANNTGFDPTSSSIHTLPNDTALQGAVTAAWHA